MGYLLQLTSEEGAVLFSVRNGIPVPSFALRSLLHVHRLKFESCGKFGYQ